jgi:Tfp pilus assembly protein PilF
MVGLWPGAARAFDPIESLKAGWQKIFPPQPPTHPPDATSLDSPGKPGPELYLATAGVYEQSGKLDLAEKQCQTALKQWPKHLGLQLAYARLQDRQDHTDEAARLYQDLARRYPKEPAVCNDLGLHYARRGLSQQGLDSLQRAVELQPQRVLYRDNIAMLLVDMGRTDPALAHLLTVHPEPVAYYNLGFLLERKGQPKVAAVYFARALEKDPSFKEARLWLERLTGTSSPPPAAPVFPAPGQARLPAGEAAMPPGPNPAPNPLMIRTAPPGPPGPAGPLPAPDRPVHLPPAGPPPYNNGGPAFPAPDSVRGSAAPEIAASAGGTGSFAPGHLRHPIPVPERAEPATDPSLPGSTWPDQSQPARSSPAGSNSNGDLRGPERPLDVTAHRADRPAPPPPPMENAPSPP